MNIRRRDPGEVEQMWDERCADLRLGNSPEELNRLGHIYRMGIVDVLDLIRDRLERLPPTERQAWLDGIYDECNNSLGAAFPAG
jgi:hypothetical protein